MAEACVRALADPSTAGRIYELGGPDVLAYRDLVELVTERMGRRRTVVAVPFPVWDILAVMMALLGNPPLTRDQVKLLGQDNVVAEQASTLHDLGIHPVAVTEILRELTGRAATPGQ